MGEGRLLPPGNNSPAAFGNLMRPDECDDVVVVAGGQNVEPCLNVKVVPDAADRDANPAVSEGILAPPLHAEMPGRVEF